MDLNDIKTRYNIIGDDPNLNRAIEIALMVAPYDLSVLIQGESGVGKEVFPKIIHQNSSRKHGKYLALNCGAIPEGTIDSELFGHEKGSFTGATEARKGYFEEADGGTLFLDEVGELPLSTQVRLLRVLETGEYIRVGSATPKKTNVRVVAASNLNFAHAIAHGKFREDLFYRLNAVPLRIPPLRERSGDIHKLFKKFAQDFAEKYKRDAIRLTPEAVQVLVNYRWPGNIRQLLNFVNELSFSEREQMITAQTISLRLPQEPAVTLPVSSGRSGGESNFADHEFIMKLLLQMQSMREDIEKLKKAIQGGQVPQLDVSNVIEIDSEQETPHEEIDEQDENLSVSDSYARLIKSALIKHNGNRQAAADELQISPRTLYRKLKKYNINL
ncbi:MAG: sigma 54-interacting transcriptional regulator [Bacteroidales bacterium]|nr:sigma 54-interacting transcriptional regulator [Bacteroidales bacterium]